MSLTGGDQHGDAFLHILCLGDETMTSHTFAIVLGHAIGTDLLLEAVYLFQVLFNSRFKIFICHMQDYIESI